MCVCCVCVLYVSLRVRCGGGYVWACVRPSYPPPIVVDSVCMCMSGMYERVCVCVL